MRPFHKSCGSTDLSIEKIKVDRNRIMIMNKCNHCNRLIESYEIDMNRILLNKAVSNIRGNNNTLHKMIVESYRK